MVKQSDQIGNAGEYKVTFLSQKKSKIEFPIWAKSKGSSPENIQKKKSGSFKGVIIKGGLPLYFNTLASPYVRFFWPFLKNFSKTRRHFLFFSKTGVLKNFEKN